MAQECMWPMQSLQDLHQLTDCGMELYYNNQLTICLVENLVFHAMTKQVELIIILSRKVDVGVRK